MYEIGNILLNYVNNNLFAKIYWNDFKLIYGHKYSYTHFML